MRSYINIYDGGGGGPYSYANEVFLSYDMKKAWKPIAEGKSISDSSILSKLQLHSPDSAACMFT